MIHSSHSTSGWIPVVCHGKFMRRIGEGSGKRERRSEGGREGGWEREDTQSEEAAGLCVLQMCRSAARRREPRSMFTGRSRHREDLRNERTGPRPLCSDCVQWALEMNSCQLWGKIADHSHTLNSNSDEQCTSTELLNMIWTNPPPITCLRALSVGYPPKCLHLQK